ncbi:MAG: asparagine synthase (glutamine-hydrolyzing) [Candidatus Omnitrophica bacterium]|nr:asparagine synthase (glutamine-hydrolyzing) [Candidatus Omnitrophota bacterium]MBI3082949.1 asparagine synthase (glutamine-hydrolyzing) [Candidatus Omnitrophota bacterium]
MCGIAGLFQFSGMPVSQAVIERMTRTLAHRGPDGEGWHVEGPIGLGHRRLAVLDLSEAGAQPMASADGQLWVTYNGELYNFQDLRAELAATGYPFRSRTDTEVILAAYQAWGPACLERFNGMFAFALWDVRHQQLWLVRDRLGVKPLFYTLQPGFLAFASEIKGILPVCSAPPALNEEALHHFLSLNYTPAPLTLFRGILQLPPGHHLTCRRDGTTQLTSYWDLQPRAATSADPAAHLAELLSDAVRLRLVSDVEVGAFLSGGLDSSAVVAWMQRHVPQRVKTFTATFREPSYDEGAYARQVAAALGTEHDEQVVEDGDLDLLPQLVWHSEELTADSSMLALYRLAQRARQKVKVVLTGDGADELFGGYSTYLATRVAQAYRWVPRPVREWVVRPLVNALPPSTSKASVESQLRRFVNGDISNMAHAHASWRVIFTEEEKRTLAKSPGDWPPTARLYEPFLAQANGVDLINRLLDADLRFYLPNDMLVKVDRMTMAWGLEARTPYLDYRLVEFAASLPSRIKRGRGYSGKQLLRQATVGLLPEPIRRRSKAGFNIPASQWLRAGRRAFVEQHLLDTRPSLLTIFERRELERVIRRHFSGQEDGSHKLWGLLCFSLWSQRFLDGQP